MLYTLCEEHQLFDMFVVPENYLCVFERKMLFSLQAENTDLKHQLTATVQLDGGQSDGQPELDEEEELDVTIEGVEEEEEEEISEVWEAWNGELTHAEEQKKDPAQPGV